MHGNLNDPRHIELDEPVSDIRGHVEVSIRSIPEGVPVPFFESSTLEEWQRTLALPLVSSLLRSRRYAEALPIVEIAMIGYLQLRDGERWDPCSSLLAAANRFAFGGTEKNVLALLERWQKVSSALGREEEGHALALQIAIAREWADGDVVLAALAGVPERFAALGKRLFDQWRDRWRNPAGAHTRAR